MRYPYTCPVTGKELEWEPLSVGQSLELVSQHKDETTRSSAMIIARIKRYDGKDGAPPPLEWRSWPDIAFELFAEEVLEKEGARKAMFRKKKVGELEGIEARLKGAIEETKRTVGELGRALTDLLEQYETAKNVKDPLG